MNKFTMVFFLFCLFALATVPAAAQRTVKLPPLFEKLNLTAEQRQKLEPLFADQQKKIKEVRDDAALSDEDEEAKMKDIRREHNKKVNEVLTAEQRTKLAELQRYRKSHQNKTRYLRF